MTRRWLPLRNYLERVEIGRESLAALDPATQEQIDTLWSLGHDTLAIADKLWLPEAIVYNTRAYLNREIDIGSKRPLNRPRGPMVLKSQVKD